MYVQRAERGAERGGRCRGRERDSKEKGGGERGLKRGSRGRVHPLEAVRRNGGNEEMTRMGREQGVEEYGGSQGKCAGKKCIRYS
eukprot:2855772-Pleurochrysis_carterae.AAC.2